MKNLCLWVLPFLCFFCTPPEESELPLPNILWITSEDNSPFAGCYGDDFATTPHMDRLAAEGFLYTHAYANAPVCAPTRNTIITGVYANSGGHEHMRSYYDKSSIVKLYPEYLREAGYYCTNNQKEDFNINPELTKNTWDELGREAHYKNRPEGKPFFAIFNSTVSHESSLHTRTPLNELRHDPEQVKLPPYHPDTPDMRHDWAQYYDKVEDMDTWMGGILQELEEMGEKENTIIFYYGDHGGVLARSKRFVYESGTRVPFIVYIPEKYKHLYPAEKPGSKVDRLVSFVDLVPTLLSIIGTDIPDYLQGHAFLGKQKTEDPEYAFMFRGRMDERYDMSRAVRDKKYRYIKNYMPYRIYGQFIEYLWRAPSIRSWEQAYLAGECNEVQSVFWNTKPVEELYDTENDPWEVTNLAADPAYQAVLSRMRNANRNWILGIRDAGFIPEATLVDLTQHTSAYEYMRSGSVDLETLVDAADFAVGPNAEISQLVALLESTDPALSYWGATGLLIQGKAAEPVKDQLILLASDYDHNGAIVAAECLYGLREIQTGRQTLLRALQSENAFLRAHALNVIDNVDDNSPAVRNAVVAMVKRIGEFKNHNYDLRMARFLLSKWAIEPASVGIDINW
ncbi:Choline-sulfatase [Lunatimonas lonarensis]|uniref:Choline-sulfatase n=1 Tax=Lunatimonas lonarensis TaxID=1232681 RepID=R7ZTJ1_9BACT|nr:sulfatase [Lunatimonas lonarensis]EON77445.1 Choline-sulfatase [Lunatimonas lonarensis]